MFTLSGVREGEIIAKLNKFSPMPNKIGFKT